MRWIEVNVEKSDSTSKDDMLIRFVRPILNGFGARVKNWHFLWEGRPWPSTLRLRFLGDDEEIAQLKQCLEAALKDVHHCYGEHGDCSENREYKGEADGTDGWGTKAWDRGMQFLQMGSEFALELVENKENLGHCEEYKKSAYHYADRYTHLFLDQIGSLVNEVNFDLSQGMFRYLSQYLHATNQSLSEQEIGNIINSMIQEVKRLLEQKAQEMIARHHHD